MAYKIGQLEQEGAKYVLDLVLRKFERMDEPCVTYGEAAVMLEGKLGIPKIFALHIGAVAGHMMREIRKVDAKVPPINALVTNKTGIPGEGFAWFYDNLWRKKNGTDWNNLSHEQKLEVLRGVREAVRYYSGWDQVFGKAFGKRPDLMDKKVFTEKDGKPPETILPRVGGESVQHRRLKEWACSNPCNLGLTGGYVGEMERDLLSGDRIDVLFTKGEEFAVVEVKSCLSSDDDLQRGIYQCVKYREVIRATRMPVKVKVRAILLSERDLPTDLAARAKILGVKSKVWKVNA